MTSLNDRMDIDHVVRVHEDGSVTDESGAYAPELIIGTDDTGQILAEHETELRESAKRQGWELLTGFTGQHGYNGPLMHPSEFVGGGLERYILANPGLYCVVVIETYDDSDEPAGWAVAHRA
jgi:hypothetical protein